ncbi:beta-glucosidase [Panacibacter ginsenosidivorans]|uniref:Beta-glucosidase n=1 Tax=Panacibacter ginsenosidivorans TaxID=1813871 RepID=A0A5B8VB69_9BACT|nr:glucoamylase family protein [Panacibacter ginsenosidivorans]QEC67906.1 beta-glucosidase [Panacibacter ginsenosidivorans]
MTKCVSILRSVIVSCCVLCACSKGGGSDPTPPVVPPSFSFSSLKVNDASNGFTYYNIPNSTILKLSFGAGVDSTTVKNSVAFSNSNGASVSYAASYENGDSTIVIKPSLLDYITKYTVVVSTSLKSKEGGSLRSGVSVNLTTQIDSSDKFPRIGDDALLDLVQKQTFKYFWDFGHPTSGLARERNSSADVCTTGGTGFGIMSMIVAASRNFVSRADALARIQKIVSFYKNNCTAYHGAFAHWINGATGATIPFSDKDDGADLVETSYLMQGLLCARQYFNAADAAETTLRNDINTLWNAVEFTWFQKSNENVLYWHWSPNYNWDMNFPIHGWNEALIVYALAASSNTHAITKDVYDNGWAQNDAMKNGNIYYGIQLPLGPAFGGPLFFAHYSFLGIDPHDLTDAYANYWTQDTAHTKINYNYCAANPKAYNGYSKLCWGLTASDQQNGYDAHAPNNDNGTISPTAAVSSLPYAPTESMNALKFFYYTLGDKLWGDYGFVDAFNLTNIWFADSYLAIDQGPMIVMIENYRTGLLWNLFMSCPEVKTGMTNLGFQSPNL